MMFQKTGQHLSKSENVLC